MISGSTTLAAVIGAPVRHSLSPALHNAAFAAAGVDWTYVAFEVVPGAAPQALDAMRTLGIGGLSVTMPHKQDVAAAVDALDPAARALRSVNTVVRRADGALEGHSTDGAGFVASLEAAGVTVDGARIAVLGAGAAARAVIDALARSGAAEIAVANRTAARAEEAAVLAGERGRVVTGAAIAPAVAAADIVVNSTSIGMGVDPAAATADDLPFDIDAVRAGQVVADLVYHPLETPLLAQARERGATVVDGLGMLVHQAVLQQRLWLGETLPAHDLAAVMRSAALRELAARHR